MVYNAEYLQNLVDDLLEQSQLHSGKLILKQEPFSPAELLNRVVVTHEVAAKENELCLQLKGVEMLPKVLIGDPARLMEIFTNLLGNAVKFTEQGEVEISAGMPDNDHWQVAVRDTGTGIVPELLDSIFEPFMQVSGPVLTRKQAGVGLGLAITKQLIELMGGTIAVASEVGLGSAFTVTLPAIHQQEERK